MSHLSDPLCRLARRPSGPQGGDARRTQLALFAFGIASVTLLILPATLRAQDGPAPPPLKPEAEEFIRPKLVLNGDGHTSPLRAVTFTPDGAYLMSGGTDKVVHIWQVEESRLKPAGSIRPALNRRAGWVYAIAASKRLPDGSYRVAVAGHGPSLQAGEIGVYRIPPRKDQDSGDRLVLLPSDSERTAIELRKGHSRPVFGLDFSTDGRYLASCSQDRTIRVWDLEAKPEPRTVRTLSGHGGEVTRVAFLSESRLVSAGGANDGTVRIWDWKQGGRPVALSSPSDNDLRVGEGVRINAMAVSPDHTQIIVGRENGRLEHFVADQLSVRKLLNPADLDDRRAVEALAFSPDGKTLAASILRYKLETDASKLIRTDCVVSVRSMPSGENFSIVQTAGDRVKALAFHPQDAGRLAIGGGEAQAVTIIDVGKKSTITSVPGPGTVIWNVAFQDSRPTLAFARRRPENGQEWAWEGFDLSTGRVVEISDPTRLSRAISSSQGWTVRTGVKDGEEFLFTLIAVAPDGREVTLRLSPDKDVRWTCYTFLPTADGQPGPIIAIGSLAGSVSFFSLPDGRKTRVFSGHSEAVYGLAPSPDGRWLMTGSADQTVRLWRLRDVAHRPGLGADLALDPLGGLVAMDVSPTTFAWDMGLRKGDRIVRCTYNLPDRVVELPMNDPGALDVASREIEPGIELLFDTIRAGQARRIQTSRRDPPALSCFVGKNLEWILWTPEGYYHSSIQGDRELLGWHVNNDPAVDTTTSFYPMSRFAAQLRKPAVIRTLLATGDVLAALRQAQPADPLPAPPRIMGPPRVRIVAPIVANGAELAVDASQLQLRVEAASGGAGRQLRSLEVRNGNVPYSVRIPDPAAPVQAAPVIPLHPDVNRISVVAADDQGVVEIARLRVRLRPPPAVKLSRPRLVIRSIGVESFLGRDFAPIRFAAEDARRVREFLTNPAQSRKPFFDPESVDARSLTGPKLVAGEILKAFDELADEARSGKLATGDTLFVFLESHVLSLASQHAVVLAANAADRPGPESAVPASAVTERLRQVGSRGCVVVVLLDGIHETKQQTQQDLDDLNDWIRDLTSDQGGGAIVLLASKQSPGQEIESERLGVFAQAVLGSMTVAGQAGRAAASGSPTLDEFRNFVANQVLEYTERRQVVGFYTPATLQPDDCDRIRIFEPQPPRIESLAGR